MALLSISSVFSAGQISGYRLKLLPVESETPLQVGTRKQLLIDNYLLCDYWRVRRVQEQVRKHPKNPILEADKPWEQAAMNTYGVSATSAIFDFREGVYKLWYNIHQGSGGVVTGYAISKDGISWTKPDLGLVEFGGSKHNNVCRAEPFGTPLMGSLQLICDPKQDSPDRRYKAIGLEPRHEDGSRYGGWLGIGFSSDGTTWHVTEDGLRSGSGGGNPSCLWEERLGRYVLFHRQLIENALPSFRHRYIVRQESPDLKTWSGRQTVFNPGMNPAWPEVESMMVFVHEGVYFGLANMLEMETRGEVELHLMTSRDGCRWEYPFPREAFIPRGPRGDFDDMLTWFAQTVVTADDMRFYYSGARYPHSHPVPPIVDDGGSRYFLPGNDNKGRVEYRPIKIGLATVPLDRLIGIRADEPVGAILTRPLLIEGDELYLNADVDRELRVEVVDPVARIVDSGRKDGIGHYIAGQEEVLQGFSMKDCEAVTGDSLSHRVRWKGGPIGKLKGKTVRLRILARMATIYAFQIK
jgi:hypothetical protein